MESERLCDKGRYDLLVIGHSIPQQDKIAIIAAFKKRSRAPVISIVRHGDNPLPQADYWTDSTDGPEALVRIVKKALSQSATSQQINKS